MNFPTAVKTCFQKYLDFKGRALRSEYWYFFLFAVLVMIVLAFAEKFLFIGPYPSLIISVVFFLPQIFAATRRLHDIGRSGWWQLIALVPVIGALVLLYWMIKKGQAGDNAYGPNPLGIQAEPEASEV